MLNNLRLGGLNEDQVNPNYDPAIQDEISTNRVMSMMRNMNDSDEDVEMNDDLANFLKQAEEKSTQKKIPQSNDHYPTEEEENEIFNRLLNVANSN